MLRPIVADPAARNAAPHRAQSRRGAAPGCARPSTATPRTASARACHATTGGNPLLVRELLHEVVHERLRADRRGGRRAWANSARGAISRWCCSGWAAARRGPRDGPRGRDPRRRRQPHAGRVAGRARRRHRRGGARRPLPRRRAHPRRARPARLRPPDRARRGLQDSRLSAGPTRPRAAACCRTGARAARRSPRTSARQRAARRRVGGRAAARRRRPRAGARRSRDRRRPTSRGRCRSRRPTPTRAAVLAELGSAEALPGRPTADAALPRRRSSVSGDPHEHGQIAARSSPAAEVPRRLRARDRGAAAMRWRSSTPTTRWPSELEVELSARRTSARRAAAAGRRIAASEAPGDRPPPNSTACI